MDLSERKLQIRTLTPQDFQEMYKAFNLAFSDYLIPIFLTYEQFEKRFIKKLSICFELSAGAFDSDRLVGFIFTAIGIYEGKKIAYNGGTGVLPIYRGNKLTLQLYEFLFPKLKENLVEGCVLEVITSNSKAFHVYKKLGFHVCKYFHSFRKDCNKKHEIKVDQFKNLKILNVPDWELFKSFSSSCPSFLDSYDVIKRNIANEQIVIFEKKNIILGYAIFQPELGRISQLAVDSKYRRRGIGTALVNYMIINSQTIAITAMNINSNSSDLLHFYKKLGFENQLDQYEMYFSLS